MSSAGPAPATILVPLQRTTVRGRKSLGQHFLRDRGALSAIVDALDLAPADRVLEIGPGTGVLTHALAGRTSQVVAVELDGRLASDLRDAFAAEPSVEILQGNALDIDPCTIFDGAYKLAGNLPYYITGLLLRHYLEMVCKPSVAVFMVQFEVAQRMTAKPGSMSMLSVATQFYADVSIVRRVPAGAFSPKPKVDSAIVKLLPRPEPSHPVPDENTFFRGVRAGFGGRRKQLVNSLATGLGISKGDAAGLLAAAEIRPTDRPQNLGVRDWSRLALALAAHDAQG
ncbi:MAG TPA: 16S rRNA (adenine(1518)-N(6)/adenine(1519)-N(6))-dimethyltransferase RsmA [Chloroflexota bacterium]|nr:16S rRNA (adenine(1518)-N(6)/adenine(1519)-N(6))-dimethyltransferase RsmA [Chloroflexota bacterium]